MLKRVQAVANEVEAAVEPRRPVNTVQTKDIGCGIARCSNKSNSRREDEAFYEHRVRGYW
jgi:hypothetical protein